MWYDLRYGNKHMKFKYPLIYIFLFAVLFTGHYLLSPNTDFTGDDWPYLQKSANISGAEIVKNGLYDIYRPFNLIANMLFFRYAGDFLILYSIVAILAHAILLLLLLLLIRHFFANPAAVWVGGVFYVLNPNIFESFHWRNHCILLYVPILFLLSFVLWLSWCNRGGVGRYITSLLLFFFGVFSYEYGVPFSALYIVVAMLYFKQKKTLAAGFGYVGIAVFYVVWRFSFGFGLGKPLLTGGEYFGSGEFAVIGVVQNIRTIISWWCGGKMGQSFLGGFNGFAVLLPKTQFLLVLISLLLLWWGYALWKRCSILEDDQFISPPWKVMVLGAFWVVLAYSPHLIFPASARHNLFPAFGMALLVAACYQQWGHARHWMPAVLMLAFVCLIANMGNTITCRDTGVFSRNLYNYVIENRANWEDKAIVVFDTQTLRDRQTRGILTPRNSDASTWATYENALLLRGFVPSAMLKLAAPDSKTQAILDTEYGVQFMGDQIEWHARYNPAHPYTTPLSDVFVVDCLSVGMSDYPRR